MWNRCARQLFTMTIVILALSPAISKAEELMTDVHFQSNYEVIERSNYKLDRLSLQTACKVIWKNKFEYSLTLPYASANLVEDGARYSVRGMKDATLGFRMARAKGKRRRDIYGLRLNLPAGVTSLDENEAPVVERMGIAYDGFSRASFGRGFDLTLSALFERSLKKNFDLSVGFAFTTQGEYLTSKLENSSSDVFDLSAKAFWQLAKGKCLFVSAGTLILLDHVPTLYGTTLHELNSPSGSRYSCGYSHRFSKNTSAELSYSYEARGTEDYVDSDGNSYEDVDFGDKSLARVTFRRTLSKKSRVSTGLINKSIGAAKSESTDETLFDSKRSALSVTVGYGRNLTNQFSLGLDLQLGLNDDAVDTVASVGMHAAL